MNRIPNDQKLKELILFLAKRSERDPRFGATKLNKLLFFADFWAFVRLGQAITWHEYQKLEHGPAPRRMLPVIDELIREGSLAWARRDYFGRTQKVAIALREPDLTTFSAAELGVVLNVIDHFSEVDGAEISGRSHQFQGWKLARDGETIPYEVALVKIVPTPSGELYLDKKTEEAVARSA